jgi:hypothetical protein
MLHARQADGAWHYSEHESGTLDIAAIGCRLPLSEIYEDLKAR